MNNTTTLNIKNSLLNTACVLLMASITWQGCKSDPAKPSAPSQGENTSTPAKVKIPKFDKDTAFAYVEKQLSFGTRVPGTPGHKAQKAWMVDQLESRGAKVYQQDFKASFFTVKDADATNIIASFNPEEDKRFILAAHWDTRLIAEKDPDVSRQEDPIPGADDGASGVAILLEVARLLQAQPIEGLGVDLIFFDAEDNGVNGNDQSWCLGSQYWSRNPHIPGYKAKGGILVDLVGAENNRYGYEEVSARFAPTLLKNVWELARAMGYTDLFQIYNAGQVLDDHYYVNTVANIPMIDIIGTPGGANSAFGPHHHTHEDDLPIISKRTLKGTGQVVTAVIYKYSEGSFVF